MSDQVHRVVLATGDESIPDETSPTRAEAEARAETLRTCELIRWGDGTCSLRVGSQLINGTPDYVVKRYRAYQCAYVSSDMSDKVHNDSSLMPPTGSAPG